jgi:hypothetical protein
VPACLFVLGQHVLIQVYFKVPFSGTVCWVLRGTQGYPSALHFMVLMVLMGIPEYQWFYEGH